MSEPITYVGIDAHKAELQVAVLVPDAAEPTIWTVRNEARAVNRLRRRLERDAPGPIACCYEAGPCGFALQRQLERGRVRCDVIASALVPRKPGERIKTDRRDARKLAELHRADLLTVVRAPTLAEEAVRDLCRARDDARADRQRCRHRLGKLLLRRGLVYPGRAWTQAHRRWVNGLTWPHPADRAVVDDYLLAIDQLETRLLELDAQLVAVADTEPYREPVGLVAVLPRHRHADRDAAARRAARCAAVSDGAGVDGVSGPGARGAFQRRPPPAGADHEDGQQLGATTGGRGGVALSTPTRRQPDTRRTAKRSAATGDRAGGQGAAAVVSPLPAAGRAQAGSGRDRGRGARARRIPVGGLASGGGVTERNLFGSRRMATEAALEEGGGAGAETTVAGVASRRCAPPPLRCGPSGDPTPATVGTAYMAGSKLPARN